MDPEPPLAERTAPGEQFFGLGHRLGIGRVCALGQFTSIPAPDSPPNPYDKTTNEYQEDFMNTNRNPFFRYRPLQKLGGMVNLRSNVYAIWVTIGYFEVHCIAPSQMKSNPNLLISSPDGFQLVANWK